VGLAVLAGAFATAPAVTAQTDGLPENITVGANATSAPGKAVLKSGVDYDVQVSGTMNRFSANDGRGGHTEFSDAYYCFGSQPTGWCSKPEAINGLFVRTSGDPPGNQGTLQVYANPRGFEPPFRTNHVYDFVLTPFKDGTLTASTKAVCGQSGYSCTGPGFTLHVSDSCRPGTQGQAAAINEVRVVAVQPSVTVHRAGAPDDEWCEVEKGDILKQGDEISCDPDGAITLGFADNSTVVVKNTSQLKIASFFTSGGVVRTEILLKMGEVRGHDVGLPHQGADRDRERPRHDLQRVLRPGLEVRARLDHRRTGRGRPGQGRSQDRQRRGGQAGRGRRPHDLEAREDRQGRGARRPEPARGAQQGAQGDRQGQHAVRRIDTATERLRHQAGAPRMGGHGQADRQARGHVEMDRQTREGQTGERAGVQAREELRLARSSPGLRGVRDL
jgi:hypothetical protein